ncbi:helix-turn-helix domain-containing protein [Salinicoccus roseus]|uniref:helix-turn-helix domain-containing protein n=1 Tax=Salinicoccus roseus TaxID=45670 RepID=UPI0035699469
MNTELMTAKEVADYLRVSQRIVYRMIKEHDLPHIKVHGKYLFKKSSVDQFLTDMEETKSS